MNNPFVLDSIYVTETKSGELGVASKTSLRAGTVIEYCAWLPVTQSLKIFINKTDGNLAKKLFPNPEGIEKERNIAARVAELDLETRLDRGLLTPEQVKSILLSVANPTDLANIVSHAILLGNGSIYRTGESPNINWEYDAESKLYKFYTVQNVLANHELTYFSN